MASSGGALVWDSPASRIAGTARELIRFCKCMTPSFVGLDFGREGISFSAELNEQSSRQFLAVPASQQCASWSSTPLVAQVALALKNGICGSCVGLTSRQGYRCVGVSSEVRY